jgi:hypothetical protein
VLVAEPVEEEVERPIAALTLLPGFVNLATMADSENEDDQVVVV